MENEKIRTTTMFIYLHCIDEGLEVIVNDKLYKIERLEWAENIGKCYLTLDFDRSKKKA